MPKYRTKLTLTLISTSPHHYLNQQVLDQDIRRNTEILIKHNWHGVEIENIEVDSKVVSQV